MARITIQPKPGLWAANAAAVDPYWREYWQDLFLFIPYLDGVPGQAVAPTGPMAGFGQGSHPQRDNTDAIEPPYWFGDADNADWVLGPVGPGLKSSLAIAINEGMRATANGRQFQVNGKDFPMAVAILFEWDGLDQADQRALISHGDFRVRINPDTEPHGIGAGSTALADVVWEDELTLLVVWSADDNTNQSDYEMMAFNLDEHPDVRDFASDQALLGDATLTADLLVGGQDANDPSEGLTVYGFWAWGGNGLSTIGTEENQWWTKEKVEKFAEDPFGMYRRAAIAQSSPISIVGTRQLGSSVNGLGVTLTYDTPPIEDDFVLLIGGHSNDGPDPISVSTPAGFTKVNEIDRGQSALIAAIFYKFMGPTPDTAVTMTGSGDAQDGAAYASIVLRGVDKTTPFDVAVVEKEGTGDDPDLNSITPITDGAWVIAGLTNGFENTATGFPTGYVNTGSIGGADTQGFAAHIATKEIPEAQAEDPSAFTLDVAFSDHGGWTIAIRPDQGAAPAGPALPPRYRQQVYHQDSSFREGQVFA